MICIESEPKAIAQNYFEASIKELIKGEAYIIFDNAKRELDNHFAV
jgi:hypothetical protein